MIKRLLPAIILSALMLSSCATGIVKVSTLKDIPAEIDMKNLPTADQHPDSDGIVLYENIVFDVDYVRGVGIETYMTVHKVYRVFRNEENFMINNLYFDRNTVFESFSGRTIKPDGTSIDLKVEDVYVLTVERNNKDFKSKLYFAEYNLPALQKGDIIEIKYTSINRHFYFSGIYWVQERLPKKYSKFEVRIPNFVFDPDWGFELVHKTKNIEIKEPSFKKGFGDTGDRSYVWENRDIPEYRHEPLSGPFYYHIGHVELQLAYWKTWNGYARDHYEKNYEPVIDKMNAKEKALIKEKAAKLTKGLTNDIDKIKALKKFVQTFNYSDTAVYFGHHVKPNKIETILKREYGDCKDHTVVLIALLREIGIKAWPALTRSDESHSVDPKFVTDIFNHVLVKVTLEGGQVLWLDPTYKFAPFGKLSSLNEDTYVLEMRPKKKDKDFKIKLEKTPASNYSDNFTEKRVLGKLENGNPKYEVVIKYSGSEAMSARYIFDKKAQKDLEKWVRTTLPYFLYDALISNITFENMHDNDSPLFLKYNLSYDTKNNRPIALFPVKPYKNALCPNFIYTENRTKPLYLNSIYATKEIYEFTFDPEKYAVINFSDEISREITDESGMSYNFKGEQSPGKVSITLDFAQKNKIVKVENIPQMLKNSVDIDTHLINIIRIRPVLKELVAQESAVEIDGIDFTEETPELIEGTTEE